MATISTIQLEVDESGASAGFTRLEQRGAAAATKLGTAVKTVRTETEALGVAGKAAGDAQAAGHDKATGHALTNLDSVRLLRDDLGIHIPRSMEKLIASTEAYQAISSVAFGGFAILGAIELVGALAGKVKDLAQEWLGNGKAVRDFYQSMVEANDQLIQHPKNTAQGDSDYQMLQAEIAKLQKSKDRSWLQQKSDETYGVKAFDDKDEAQLIKDQQMLGELAKNNADQKRTFNEEDRKATEANTAAALDGLNKIAQERKNAYADIDQKLNVDHSITPDQAAAQKRDADGKAAAESLQLQRQYNDQVTELRAQAQQAGLRGEQRMYAEMEAAAAKFVVDARRNGEAETQIAAGVAAMRLRYVNEVAERKEDFENQTREMAAQNAAAGRTGTAKIMAEELADLEKLKTARINAGQQAVSYDQAYADRRVQIAQRASNDIDAEMRQYRESGVSSHDTATASVSTGYDKIGADQTKETDDALKEYHRYVDGMAADDQRRLEAAQILQGKLDDIQTTADQKQLDLHRRAQDETLQIEESAQSTRSGATREGLAGIFQQEQDSVNKVEAEYEKQTRKLQEEIDKREISMQDAADRQAAIDDQRDAQMAETQRNSRDKLASALESSFKDPMGSIRSNMEHQFAEMMANWIMQLGWFKKMFHTTMDGTLTAVAPGAQASAPGGATSGMSAVGGAISGFRRSGASGGVSAPSNGPGGGPGFVSADYSGGSSTFTNAGGGGYTSAPASTRGGVDAGSLTDTVSSAATTGYGQFKSLSADYSQMKAAGSQYPLMSDFSTPAAPTADVISPSDTAPGASDSWAPGNVSSSADSMDASDSPSAGSLPTTSDTSTASGKALGVAGAGMAAYGGTKSLIGGFEQGGAKGYLHNAMAGAEMGAEIGMLAGPEGALIGAAAGAVVGLGVSAVSSILGASGKIKARKYFHDQLEPAIAQDMQEFRTGGGDFQTAIAGINMTAAQGMEYAQQHFGQSAADYMNNTYLLPLVTKDDAEIDRLAKAGIAGIKASTAQFHTGGTITDFGNMWTSSDEGFIHARLGEKVVNPFASMAHGGHIDAINAGASPAEMAGRYLASMTGGGSTSGPGGGGDTHFHVHTLDPKTMDHWLKTGGATLIKKHINSSYGNYSGAGNG